MPPSPSSSSEGADARCRGRRGGTSLRDAGRTAPRIRRAGADADADADAAADDDGVDG